MIQVFRDDSRNQHKNLTRERMNTDPGDHKWHCSFQIKKKDPDARVPSIPASYLEEPEGIYEAILFSSLCVKELTRLYELIHTAKTQSINNSVPRHENWLRDRHVPHQGQRVCPGMCWDDQETSTALFSWNWIYRCLTFPMIWTEPTERADPRVFSSCTKGSQKPAALCIYGSQYVFFFAWASMSWDFYLLT